MKTAYRDVTLGVEDAHWWYRGRRLVIDAVLERDEMRRRARILDAGCGGGGNLELLSHYGSVTGLESSPEAAERARARGVGDIVEGSLEAMPFPAGGFDLAVTLDVLEHLDDDVAGFRELRRVVAPGGRLLVTVPAYPRLWSLHDEVNEHRRRYVRRTLVGPAEATGWRVVRVTNFNLGLLAPAAARRVVERMRRDPSSRSDFEVTPPWLDRPLLAPFRLEARWIGAGRSLRAGLSLLGLFDAA